MFKDKLTVEEFSQIENLMDCALTASNKKEAKPYIQQIEMIGLHITGSAKLILGQLTCAISSASGRIPDKDRQTDFAKMELYKLRDHLEPNEIY